MWRRTAQRSADVPSVTQPVSTSNPANANGIFIGFPPWRRRFLEVCGIAKRYLRKAAYGSLRTGLQVGQFEKSVKFEPRIRDAA